MIITGIPFDDFVTTVDTVSHNLYSGNVIVHRDARDLHGVRRPRLSGRIVVKSSRGPGARRSWTGRRMPAACWHVFRDVLAEIFRRYPDAVARTGMATYKGAQGFLDLYPETGWRNIGSPACPAYMPDLCDCHDTLSHADIQAYVLAARVPVQPTSDQVAAIAAEHGIGSRKYQDALSCYFGSCSHAEHTYPGFPQVNELAQDLAQRVQRNPAATEVPAQPTSQDMDRIVTQYGVRSPQYHNALRCHYGCCEHLAHLGSRARAVIATPVNDAADDDDAALDRAMDAIGEAEKLLAEVAAEGWTNPYTHKDSPAWKLADSRQ